MFARQSIYSCLPAHDIREYELVIVLSLSLVILGVRIPRMGTAFRAHAVAAGEGRVRIYCRSPEISMSDPASARKM